MTTPRYVLLAVGGLVMPRDALAGCASICAVGGGSVLWLLVLGGGGYLIYRLLRERSDASLPPSADERRPTP